MWSWWFYRSHLVKSLKIKVIGLGGIDLKYPEFSESLADDFVICDLRNQNNYKKLFDRNIDELYQLAADMGGAGYLFTERMMLMLKAPALINLNTLDNCREFNVPKVFYSSLSACVYPEYNQMDPENPKCTENTVYPADPDSEYGWEKLFSERMYKTFEKNFNIVCKIARFHNIYGP